MQVCIYLCLFPEQIRSRQLKVGDETSSGVRLGLSRSHSHSLSSPETAAILVASNAKNHVTSIWQT